MEIFTFIAIVVTVTASGALAPGPAFANITHGIKYGAKSGLAFSVGHTIFEFSLVTFLAFSLQTVANEPLIKLVVGVAGVTALLIFGFFQIRGAIKLQLNSTDKKETSSKNPLLSGIIFTGLNPYFIIWWFTAGLPLIENAINLVSFAGVLIMYISHVWIDYAWFTGTAYLAKKGTNIVSKKGYRILIGTFGLILVLFGLYFLMTPIL